MTLGNIILFIYEHLTYDDYSLIAINFGKENTNNLVFFWLYVVDIVL